MLINKYRSKESERYRVNNLLVLFVGFFLFFSFHFIGKWKTGEVFNHFSVGTFCFCMCVRKKYCAGSGAMSIA